MKVARLGIKRDPELMYYVDECGDVCAIRRSRPGQPPGEKIVIAKTDFVLDRKRFLYYLDLEGDVCAKERQVAPSAKPARKRSRPARAKRSKQSRATRSQRSRKR